MVDLCMVGNNKIDPVKADLFFEVCNEFPGKRFENRIDQYIFFFPDQVGIV